ncbi:MAG: NAD-dependent epimerase/dehydratase family protein [Armatimonadota bacterium]
MRVLFIGGTGVISSACTELALARGIELFHLNRGTQEPPAGVTTLRGDIRRPDQVAEVLKPYRFDAVVEWVAYQPEHIDTDLALFAGKTDQYVFISTTATYQKPPVYYRLDESAPQYNPYWEYAQLKIACEERLRAAYRQQGVPMTIVRPSHTYGDTKIPYVVGSGYIVVDRMRRGKPTIVPGDGQALWTMTHNTDFAKGLVGLLGNPQAIGESFHITSDEVLTWEQIARVIGRAAGVEPELIHIPSDLINHYDAALGANLLGDKTYNAVFDTGKIKRAVPGYLATVPFTEGIRRAVAWHDADPARQQVNPDLDATLDWIIEAYRRAW